MSSKRQSHQYTTDIGAYVCNASSSAGDARLCMATIDENEEMNRVERRTRDRKRSG
jgi:hypothetical protein